MEKQKEDIGKLKQMLESDKNMLKVIDFLKDSGEISFKTDAYEVMKISKQNVWKIKNPDRFPKQAYHFTAEQISLFCNHFKINANFIFGFESKIYRK